MTAPNRIVIFAAGDSDAEWLSNQVSGQEESGFVVELVVSYSGQLDDKHLSRADAIVVDSSLGSETTQHLLYELMMRQSSLPVILCIDADQEGEFPDAVRQGAQDFIIKGSDSTEIIQRVFLHALDRAQILRATQEAEERVRAIIENISDGILIVDEADTILFANPACELILNRQLIELLGAPLELEIPKAADATVEIQHTPDSSIVASLRWVPIRWEGRDVRLYTIRDVSVEFEIREQLQKTKDEAERLAALKTSFLANMSHELRMPLASMIGFAQLIEEGIDHEEYKEFAGMIVEGGNKLLETINSILELTRLDAQTVEMRKQLISLENSANEVVNSLRPLLDEKTITVQITVEGIDTITADPLIIRRIFNNLIGNAIKFTNNGSIAISFVGTNDAVRCEISDSGIGIDPEFLPHVFDEFAQESTGRGRTHGGTGLGLTITQRLVSALSGSIEVSSKKGRGSTFTLVFPRLASQK
ncbi:MAG: ATP-binding protein [Bacteroidetes bacterium]|nr:ATP-binding protein [Bacteroidota bacterium]